jgi:hypothetical protein
MNYDFIRIESFRVLDSPAEAGMELYLKLQTLAQVLRNTKGCKSAQAMMSTQEPTLFVLVEVWENSKARHVIHSLSVASSDIPNNKLAEPSTVRTFTI